MNKTGSRGGRRKGAGGAGAGKGAGSGAGGKGGGKRQAGKLPPWMPEPAPAVRQTRPGRGATSAAPARPPRRQAAGPAVADPFAAREAQRYDNPIASREA